MVVHRFPGIDPIIYPHMPIIENPLGNCRDKIGYVLLQGFVSSTTVIPIHQSSTTSSELIVRPPVRTEGKFLMFPSNQDAIYVSWFVLIILGASPSSTCDVVLKMTSSSPSSLTKTIRFLKNRKLSKSLWDTSRHHPSLSHELTFLHTFPKIISSETQWCLSLLVYFCQMVRGVWRKRIKKDLFVPTLTLFFSDRSISAKNNGKLQLRKFPMPNFVCF